MAKKNTPRFNENLSPALSTETAKEIISEIKKWTRKHSIIDVDNTRWYCGITNNPPKRKSGHKYDIEAEPYAWKNFNAKSRRIAEAIETHFHRLGMKDHDTKGGSAEDSKYVYVYKKHPTWFD